MIFSNDSPFSNDIEFNRGKKITLIKYSFIKRNVNIQDVNKVLY